MRFAKSLLNTSQNEVTESLQWSTSEPNDIAEIPPEIWQQNERHFKGFILLREQSSFVFISFYSRRGSQDVLEKKIVIKTSLFFLTSNWFYLSVYCRDFSNNNPNVIRNATCNCYIIFVLAVYIGGIFKHIYFGINNEVPNWILILISN